VRIVLIFVLGILDSLGTTGGFGLLPLILVKLHCLGDSFGFLLLSGICWDLWSFTVVSLRLGHWLRVRTHAIVEQVTILLATDGRGRKGFQLITLVGVLVQLVVLVNVLSMNQIFIADFLGFTDLVNHLIECLMKSLRRSILGEVRDYELYLICIVLLQQHWMAMSMR
jgi:hypothetical protein